MRIRVQNLEFRTEADGHRLYGSDAPEIVLWYSTGPGAQSCFTLAFFRFDRSSGWKMETVGARLAEARVDISTFKVVMDLAFRMLYAVLNPATLADRPDDAVEDLMSREPLA